MKPRRILKKRPKELRFQIAIKSVQEEVVTVLMDMCAWLAHHHVARDVIDELELVLAEALNNVVEHAYLYAENGEINILLRLRPSQIRVTITDSGRAFDGPPQLKDMNVEDMDFEELPEGGFGWNLIRTLTDDVEFEHKDKQNRLTLTRNLGAVASA